MKTKKIVLWGIIIVAICVTGYTIGHFREELTELITNKTEKTVDEALNFFKNNPVQFDPKSSGTFLSLFSSEYKEACFSSPYLEMLLRGDISYTDIDYKNIGLNEYNLRNYILSWKLSKQRINNETFVVEVKGSTADLDGMDGKTQKPIYSYHTKSENVKFILKKREGKWKIVDSYNFLKFLVFQDSSTLVKSDLEKYKLLKRLQEEVELHISDLKLTEDNSIYFTCKVNGEINNKSNIPLYYSAIIISFKGMNKYSTSTVHFATINELIQPHERKSFSQEENVYYNSGRTNYFSSLLDESRTLQYKYSYRLIFR